MRNKSLDWFKDKLQETINFIQFTYQHFLEDDCTYRASALAFTSLLALIPLMTVGLSVLSSLPVFQNLSGPVQNFIFDNFVPTTGKIIQGYLQQFSMQVSKLSTIGIITLFITALLLMFTIERAMNRIWHVSTPRKGIAAFLLYWAILSLAPVILGLSLVVSSYIASIPFLHLNQAPSLLLNLVPASLSILGFTFLYIVVPNCPVKFTHGLIGGLFSALLFETAKHAFTYYLSHYDSYQLIYGAFAILPIFFIWIYWCWFITLLGAEVSYALSVGHERRVGKSLDGFSHALIWLYALWQAQQQGRGLTLDELIHSSPHPYSIDIQDMQKTLLDLQLIHRSAEAEYHLSQDLSKLSLFFLSQRLPYRLPNLKEIKLISNFNWALVLQKGEKALEKNLNLSLSRLFSRE